MRDVRSPKHASNDCPARLIFETYQLAATQTRTIEKAERSNPKRCELYNSIDRDNKSLPSYALERLPE
jgi:hypothetical protein